MPKTSRGRSSIKGASAEEARTMATPLPHNVPDLVTLPATELRVAQAPWSLGGVTLVMGRYQESANASYDPSRLREPSINSVLRTNIAWTDKRDLEVLLHATATTKHLPTEVFCEVVYRMVIVRTASDDDTSLFDFARSVGVRALFPYARAGVATISAQGSYGAITLQPVAIEVVVKE